LIDLHSHILPGIDDGARDMSDALLLAEQAIEQGVTHMVCTPHINPSVFDNTKEMIADAFEEFVKALKDQKLDLPLSFACEVRLTAEVTKWIPNSRLPFLGEWDSKSALLLELPHSHIPAGTDSLINWLLKQGVQPIIPHPERNRDILANYSKASWLKSLGVLFQATAGAFTGTFGEHVENTAFKMLDDKLIAYVASDMHNLKRRPNEMAQAYEAIASYKGSLVANRLFIETPRVITSSIEWR